MLEDRLRLLRMAGYSRAQVEKFIQSFPRSFVIDIGKVATSQEAKEVAQQYLAESKSSLEGIE